MAKTKQDGDDQVAVEMTAEVRLEEWRQTLAAGQALTVKRSLLDDPRLAGKFKER